MEKQVTTPQGLSPLSLCFGTIGRLTLAVLFALTLFGCAAAPRRIPTTPQSTAAASTDDSALSEAALEKARRTRLSKAGDYLIKSYREAFEPDVTDLAAAYLNVHDTNGSVHDAMQYLPLAKQTALNVNAALEDAFAPALEALNAYLPVMGGSVPGVAIELTVKNGFGWRELMAFLRACVSTGRSAGATSMLGQALSLEASLSYDEEGNELRGELIVSAAPFGEIWKRVSPALQEYITGRIGYAYLITVYDDEGERKPYSEPDGSKEALSDIASPVRGGKIRKTWYAPRDRGKRVHTGTDILAPEETPIRACTSGTVIANATGLGAGNYIVVLDDAGYEFHYYHMVRRTSFLKEGDRVKRGDVIGNVGNTGNSDANHLHLSIIHPSGAYVNPYPYVVSAEKGGR